MASRDNGDRISGPIIPPSRGEALAALLTLLLAAKMAALALSDASASPWWIVIPAVVAFTGVLLLGARYHRAMREQLAMRASGRS